MPQSDYIKDPSAIYAESFAIVRQGADLSKFDPDMAEVAVRLVHACGMMDVVDDIEASSDFTRAATDALHNGAPVWCDCEMVVSGITRKFLPASNKVVTTLNDKETPGLAKELQTTRSAAAVDLWRDHMDGSLMVIGNAPTALFRCLEIIADDGPQPAAIIGCPVGFVGAAQSKAALAQHKPAIPFLVVHGTRGGSAMASSVVNAIGLGAGESVSRGLITPSASSGISTSSASRNSRTSGASHESHHDSTSSTASTSRSPK